jgi:hypothetical protein
MRGGGIQNIQSSLEIRKQYLSAKLNLKRRGQVEDTDVDCRVIFARKTKT